MRRELGKKGKLVLKAKAIVDRYNSWREAKRAVGGQADQIEGNEGNNIAPHPGRGNRAEWVNEIEPRGPVGLVMQSLICIGA